MRGSVHAIVVKFPNGNRPGPFSTLLDFIPYLLYNLGR